MPKNNCTLIVLSYTKYKDTQLIIHSLSKEYGKRSFLVKVSKKSSGSLFLPLNIINGIVTENPKSQLWYISGISSQAPLIDMRSNLNKNIMSLFISEIMYKCIKDGENDPYLFDWFLKNILTLEHLKTDFANFHLSFLLDLTSRLGFMPSYESLIPFCQEGNEKYLNELLKSSFEGSMSIKMSGTVRSSIVDTILRYLEFHLGLSLNINSLKILQDIYYR